MLPSLYRWLVMLLGDLLTFVYVREYVVTGRENVPPEGSVIVACNHLNNADPPFIARALGRPPIFMAKKEMLDMPLFGLAFRAWGAFPVRRGEFDPSAIRAAMAVLQRGEMLLMFPEGTRSRTGGLGRGHPGTALIALRSRAPVLPVAITGTEGIRWPGFLLRPRSTRRISVVIGEPLLIDETSANGPAAKEEATELIMKRIAELLPPSYRGDYANDETVPVATPERPDGRG